MNSLDIDPQDSCQRESVLHEQGTNIPEQEYYMVDYFDKDRCSHIRLPFVRQEQVFVILNKLQDRIKQGSHIVSLRVLPEEFLDEPYVCPEIIEDGITTGMANARFLCATTREVLFDKRYQAIAEGFSSRKEQESKTEDSRPSIADTLGGFQRRKQLKNDPWITK